MCGRPKTTRRRLAETGDPPAKTFFLPPDTTTNPMPQKNQQRARSTCGHADSDRKAPPGTAPLYPSRCCLIHSNSDSCDTLVGPPVSSPSRHVISVDTNRHCVTQGWQNALCRGAREKRGKPLERHTTPFFPLRHPHRRRPLLPPLLDRIIFDFTRGDKAPNAPSFVVLQPLPHFLLT